MLTRLISVFGDYRWFLFASPCILMFWGWNVMKRTHCFVFFKEKLLNWVKKNLWSNAGLASESLTLNWIFLWIESLDPNWLTAVSLSASACHMESRSALDSFHSHTLILSPTDDGSSPPPLICREKSRKALEEKRSAFPVGPQHNGFMVLLLEVLSFHIKISVNSSFHI